MNKGVAGVAWKETEKMMERPVDLLELSDLATPWCLRVVSTLRIPEHMATGIRSAAELAAVAGCNRDCLVRVLRRLASKGVFAEVEDGVFELNAAARGLLDGGARMRFDLDGLGGRMAAAWGGLLGAVRTGGPTYGGVVGLPFWEDLDAHPELSAQFDAMMGQEGPEDPDVLISGGWENIRRVVDVGGGTGALLAAVLREHPSVEGVLVDLPRTVARSPEVFASAGVSDRVTVSAQSFFDPLPAGDVYLLKSVMPDWPDQEATAILRNCALAGGAGCRVVVVSGRSTNAPGEADLLMLVVVGGKMRSLADFRLLAKDAGLKLAACGPNPAGRFIVECTPV